MWWQSEYFLELSEFYRSKARYKIEEACYAENVVLIHENHIPQFNFRVGVIDSFMPATRWYSENCYHVLCYKWKNRN